MPLETLPVLEGPYEFLKLAPGESVTFHVIRWQLGRVEYHPPWRPAGVLEWSRVLRMHLPTTEKPTFPHYFDVGQKTLVPQLEVVLPRAAMERVGITIMAVGSGPKKRFSVGLETVG